MTSGDELWTIDELGARVAEALSAADAAAGRMNGRVREVPDLRTIRYYTTLGLIDRAAEMRGRTALYGRRHLLQLVAIKRLQARGLSLAEVQRELLGRTDADLERYIAPGLPGVGAAGGKSLGSGAAPPAAGGSRPPLADAESDRADFWKSAATPDEPSETSAPPAPSPPTNGPSPPASMPMQGLPLADDVVLLLTPARALERADIEALRAAAGPLLKVLRSRRLLGVD